MSSTSGYGALPQGEGEIELNQEARVRASLPGVPKSLIDFIQNEPDDNNLAARDEQSRELGDESHVIKFKINPESCRFIAYVCFWFMCFFAIAVTTFVTGPLLLEGPADPTNTCPPFEDGKGFDIKTNSHLIRAFGFNNICANWDYTPSRELTAMVYPAFEYSLVIYIVLDFINSAINYQKGYVSYRYWIVAQIVFPIMVILCAWFRMIFVVVAYVNVQGHTAGFLGLQVTLVLIAVTNVWYVMETRVSYNFLGGLQGTRYFSMAYLIGDLLICGIKVYLTSSVVFGSSGYPTWALQHTAIAGKTVGQLVDLVWMIFNALLPLVISYIRAKSERPLEFTIDCRAPKYSSVTTSSSA